MKGLDILVNIDIDFCQHSFNCGIFFFVSRFNKKQNFVKQLL